MSDRAVPLPEVEELDALLENYHVIRLIGHGGMGGVYEAHHLKLDRKVALKVLPMERSAHPEFAERFLREARALAALSHPHIVTVHDFGEAGEAFFFAMEFIDGSSLAEIIRTGSLTPAQALAIVPQICDALAYAHEAGVVHRDIKPGNILIDKKGVIKLADFGLAKLLGSEEGGENLTLSGAVFGTPAYMAPEQREHSAKIDHRADIFSLGVVFYEMLTGEIPAGHFDPPSKRVAVDVRLDEVVLRAMSSKPERRYQHASEFKERVEAATSHRVGTKTKAASKPRLTRRWRLVGATATLAILGALVWTLFFAGGEDSRQAEAQRIEDEDPMVVTVSKDGETTTIGEAVAAVKPGGTIRILDDGIYQETIVFEGAKHEGVTLEAANGRPTIRLAPGNPVPIAIHIKDVKGLRLRGLRLESVGPHPQSILCSIYRNCSSLVVEDVQFVSKTGGTTIGVTLEHVDGLTGAPPVTIRSSTFERVTYGVSVNGFGNSPNDPRICRNIVIADNRLADVGTGVIINGSAQDVTVAGNLVHGATSAGLQFQFLFPDAKNILVANNTLFECFQSLRVWEEGAPKGENFRITNNLSLASRDEFDWIIFDSANPGDGNPRGAGDGKALLEKWTFDHNWREAVVPSEDHKWIAGWIPTADSDVRKNQIEGLSRDPKEKSFLQPEMGSPLAGSGAGTSDRTLPSYVGAVPPPNAPEWPWTPSLVGGED